MRYARDITLSVVLFLIPTLVMVNFLQLAFYYNTGLSFDTHLLNPTQYYFGFRSLLLIADDMQASVNLTLDLFVPNVRDLHTYIDNCNELVGKVFEVVTLNDYPGLRFNYGTFFELVGNFFLVGFAALGIAMEIIMIPFAFSGDLLFVLIKTILGQYNLPIVQPNEYIIPNWNEVWDFTFNLRLLLS